MIKRLAQHIKNARYELSSRFATLKPQVEYKVPYVCQFATPEHAELSLRKTLAPKDDSHWQESGAISAARYADWAFTMCGMASTAMAYDYFHGKQIKPAALAEDALAAGVYTSEESGISSMKYREFSKWISKYNLQAEVYSRLSIRGIQNALSRGSLVIVSVNPNIRGYNTASPSQKGGHLILMTGYSLTSNTLSLNNPSGFVSTNTQIGHTLPVSEFKQFYAGRGIVVSPL